MRNGKIKLFLPSFPSLPPSSQNRAGDFNYRLENIDADAAAACARAGDLSTLKRRDQLTKEKAAGRCFVGMSEAEISFAPTYKYDKHSPGLCFDSSEKRRVPAWCDRVLFRGSKGESGGGDGSGGGGGRCESEAQQRDTGAAAAAAAGAAAAGIAASAPLPPASVACTSYGSLPDVLDSDHKPVWATLRLTLAALDAPAARRAAAEALEIADGEEEEEEEDAVLGSPPSLSATLAPDEIVLSRRAGDLSPPGASAALANTGRVPLVWALRGSSAGPGSRTSSRGEHGDAGAGDSGTRETTKRTRPRHPSWLDARPAGGLLLPGEAAELRFDAVVAAAASPLPGDGSAEGGGDAFSSFGPLAPPQPPPPPPPARGSRSELRVSAWRVGGDGGGGGGGGGRGDEVPWERTLVVRLE